jgi:UV DNA damage endonuclease
VTQANTGGSTLRSAGPIRRAATRNANGRHEGLRLGYACLNTQLPTPARTIRAANATPRDLARLLASNLDALEAILRWNDEHDIRVFRLSSGVVPLATHPSVSFPWRREFAGRLAELGAFMRSAGMRLSMHPGPYTVLASANEAVAEAAAADLEYHAELMEAFGLDSSHKIVLHLGGGAGDRVAWVRRFAARFERLSRATRSRLALENDERWSLEEVLAEAGELGIPVVFDAFHDALRPSFRTLGLGEVVQLVGWSWTPSDGRQEVHFSTQAPTRRVGAHAETLDVAACMRFVDQVADLPIDCVLEVKDKEQSVLLAREALVRSR